MTEQEKMDLETGIRISGLTGDISQKDLKVYFSNPRNGGGKITKLYHPLKDGDAVIFFDSHGPHVSDLVRKAHDIKGQKLRIKKTMKMFSKVTVELEQVVSDHLERNPSYLDNLQFDGELDMNFDDNKQTYAMIGDWYQIEWALGYIEDTIESSNNTGVKEDHGICDSGFSVIDKNEESVLETSVNKQEATHGGNIKWNFTAENPERPMQCNISMPIVTHVTAGEDSDEYDTTRSQESVTIKSPYMNNFDISPTEGADIGRNRSPLFHDNRKETKYSDSKDYLLGNPLHLSNRRNYTHEYTEYLSDDTDDELEAARTGNSFPFPRMPLHDPFPRRRAPSPKGIEILHSDFGDIPLTYDTVIKNIQVKLLMGDILKEKSDAIVNPANKDLRHTYGISNSIARMAGRNLQEECRNYIQRHGQLAMGDVMHTCAGGALNERVGFVLHTVPPSWREEESESTAHILTCTYLNCLQYANKQLWLGSLSVPLIGAGGMGIPLDVSVQAFFDAVILHTSEDKQTNHLQTVNLVSNSQDSTCAMIVVMRSLKDLDEDECQKAAIDRYISKKEKFNFNAKEFWLDLKATEDEAETDEKTEVDKAQCDSKDQTDKELNQTGDVGKVDKEANESIPLETIKMEADKTASLDVLIKTDTERKEQPNTDTIRNDWDEKHFAETELKVTDKQDDMESTTQCVTHVDTPDKLEQSAVGESVRDMSIIMNGRDATGRDCDVDEEDSPLSSRTQVEDCQLLDSKDTDKLLDSTTSDS